MKVELTEGERTTLKVEDGATRIVLHLAAEPDMLQHEYDSAIVLLRKVQAKLGGER